jgi:hypothetical protein
MAMLASGAIAQSVSPTTAIPAEAPNMFADHVCTTQAADNAFLKTYSTTAAAQQRALLASYIQGDPMKADCLLQAAVASGYGNMPELLQTIIALLSDSPDNVDAIAALTDKYGETAAGGTPAAFGAPASTPGVNQNQLNEGSGSTPSSPSSPSGI